MAKNASTNIIHMGGITTAGAETYKNQNEKKGTEAKEDGHVAEEDGIGNQKMDDSEDECREGQSRDRNSQHHHHQPQIFQE